MAVEQRLHDLAHERLDDEEQAGRPDQHRPARIDRQGKGGGKDRGDDGPDIGNEAQQHRKDAPEHGIGYPDQPQPRTDQDAEGGVDRQLHQQIATEALGGIVQGLGRLLQVMGAREANEAVAQVFPLQEEEDDEDDDDSGGRQRLKQRADDRLEDLERRQVGLMDLDRNRCRLGAAARGGGNRHRRPGRSRGRRVRDLVAEPLQHGRRTANDSAARRRALQGMDLLGHIGLVLRQILGQMGELVADDRPQAEDQDKGQQDGRDDGRHPADMPAAKEHHQGPKGEAQQQSQSQRDEDFSGEIEGGDDEHGDGQIAHRRALPKHRIGFPRGSVVAAGIEIAHARDARKQALSIPEGLAAPEISRRGCRADLFKVCLDHLWHLRGEIEQGVIGNHAHGPKVPRKSSSLYTRAPRIRPGHSRKPSPAIGFGI